MSICTNHCTNQNKVRKIVPTTVSTTFNKWQNSAEKSQAHNLKVVGSNPTPATNLFHKITDLYDSQGLRFLGLFVIIFSVCTNHHTNWSSGFFFSLTLILNIIFYSTSTGLFQNCTIIVPLF